MAGDAARVENLLSARAEPHEYAFTPGAARRLNAASLVLANGLGLEPWLDQWRDSSPAARGKLLVIADQLPQLATLAKTRGEAQDPVHGHHDDHGINPHFWLDPLLAQAAVSNIAVALARIDAPRAPLYASNAAAYTVKLQRLDADLRAGLEGLTNRALVTYHDAFPWFAKRYGLEIAGVVERVPDVNPTPRDLAALIRMMKQRGLRAIFVPPNSSSRLARQIAKDLRVQLLELDTLETGHLSPGAYEARMRANLASLQKGLRP